MDEIISNDVVGDEGRSIALRVHLYGVSGNIVHYIAV